MKSWYLIQTKPRQEQLAKDNLRRQGYEVYLPRIRLRRRRQGRSYLSHGPMFPLYLFINLSDGVDDWGPIRSTVGVARLVRFGEIPARVPEDLITDLRGREGSDGIQILPERQFKEGEKVRIAEGLFEGYEAVIHEKSSRERAVLLLKIIENYVKLELKIGQLDPIDS